MLGRAGVGFVSADNKSVTVVTRERQPRRILSGMRAPFLILGAALLVAGCGTTADCGSDWYTKGWSDGRYGAFAQADLYARRCPGVDADAYNKGWRDGNSARPALGGM
jgi:hypothetical protein